LQGAVLQGGKILWTGPRKIEPHKYAVEPAAAAMIPFDRIDPGSSQNAVQPKKTNENEFQNAFPRGFVDLRNRRGHGANQQFRGDIQRGYVRANYGWHVFSGRGFD
jgi:hypothetical protein